MRIDAHGTPNVTSECSWWFMGYSIWGVDRKTVILLFLIELIIKGRGTLFHRYRSCNSNSCWVKARNHWVMILVSPHFITVANTRNVNVVAV